MGAKATPFEVYQHCTYTVYCLGCVGVISLSKYQGNAAGRSSLYTGAHTPVHQLVFDTLRVDPLGSLNKCTQLGTGSRQLCTV